MAKVQWMICNVEKEVYNTMQKAVEATLLPIISPKQQKGCYNHYLHQNKISEPYVDIFDPIFSMKQLMRILYKAQLYTVLSREAGRGVKLLLGQWYDPRPNKQNHN